MDPIEFHLTTSKRFRTNLLLSSHAALRAEQSAKGWPSYQDILQSLRSTSSDDENISEAELAAHAALILEGGIVTSVTAEQQIKLQLSWELVNNDSLFLRALGNILMTKYEYLANE